MTWHEATGAGAAASATIAQAIPDGDLVSKFLSLGATGVLGVICWYLIRENRRVIADLQASHTKESESKDKAIKERDEANIKAMAERDRDIAMANATALSGVAASNRDAAQRYETSVSELFRVQREMADTLSKAIVDATKPVADCVAAQAVAQAAAKNHKKVTPQ